MGLNYDYLLKRWGFASQPEFAPKIIAVTTGVKQVVGANPDRLLLFVQNIGTNNAYFLDQENVASDRCMFIDKNGGFWEMPIEWYGEYITHEFWIKGDGSTNLLVVSVEGYKRLEE